MLTTVHIENYKSVRRLDLELGRVTVLIGENGCGKSNILEAIAIASAAAHDKLDNEFLASRGVRVTEPRFMRSAFGGAVEPEIRVDLKWPEHAKVECRLQLDDSATYPKWIDLSRVRLSGNRPLELGPPPIDEGWAAALAQRRSIADILIFSPENTALRTFRSEGQILPLGIRGEGLFAHLRALAKDPHTARLAEIIEKLKLIDWFDSFELPKDLAPDERVLRIRDRYLAEGALFDQRSANEGFLFLLFYFTLLISPDTPKLLAIDNADASLNPKLCGVLLKEIAALAREHDRQVILTTHNAAMLDGLDLNDPEQRLFVVDRSAKGETRVTRIEAPEPIEGDPPMKLSEAFLRGYIGGLPQNF